MNKIDLPSVAQLNEQFAAAMSGKGNLPLGSSTLLADDEVPRLRVGMVTDLHYADKAPAATRHYRETLAKLEEAAQWFEQDKPSFLVELGDLIDAADSVDVEQSYSKRSTGHCRRFAKTDTTFWAITVWTR